MKIMENIGFYIFVGFILLILLFCGYLYVQSAQALDYCKDNEFDGVGNINIDGFNCYNYIEHYSGVGRDTQYTGEISWKEIK